MNREHQRTYEHEGHMIEESLLIDDIRSGNRMRFDAAWKELYGRYFNRIAVAMSGRVEDNATAKDITQRAFVKAAEHLDGFQQGSSFFTWVYKIAQNLSIDHVRKSGRRKTSSLGDNDAHAIEDRRALPDTRIERREMRTKINAAFARLSPNIAQTMRLRTEDGLSYKEIAARQGVPEGTVMSRISNARKKLAEYLQDE